MKNKRNENETETYTLKAYHNGKPIEIELTNSTMWSLWTAFQGLEMHDRKENENEK